LPYLTPFLPLCNRPQGGDKEVSFKLKNGWSIIDPADHLALQLVTRSGPCRFFAIGDFPPMYLQQEELNVRMVGTR
jgi:hypothetical protein